MPVKLVEPPAIARGGRASTVDQADLHELAKQSERGWATVDGESFNDKKAAQTALNKWKRHVSTLQDDRKVRGRVWQDGKKWVWAVNSQDTK